MRHVLAGVLVVALLAFGADRVEAVEFLRADVNSDGDISISDPYALLSFLFRGLGVPDCVGAWDANADGTTNISDAVVVLANLFLGGQALPDGPSDPPLGCNEYGDGSPLDDPAANLVILSAESAGGEDGKATLVLGASHSTAIGGHSFSLRLPEEIFAGSETGGVDLTDSIGDTWFDGGSLTGEVFSHGFLASLVGYAQIPASADVVPIYELVVCLREGTPAGEYPIDFADAEFVDAASGRAIEPMLVGGTLTVAADVTVAGDCSTKPNPDPSPKPTPGQRPGPPPFGPTTKAENVTWRIEDAVGAPGDSIVLPFVMHADGQVQGYSFSVDFDEELLTATEIEEAWKIPGGDFPYGFSKYEINNENESPGNDGVDEGFLIGALVFSLVSEVSMPANEDVVAQRFHFDIRPDAPDTTTEIRFEDGGQVSGQPVQNAVTSRGESVGIEFLQSFVLVDCTLHIEAIVDITTFFVRGDANGDGGVDLSDAQHTLNYLFTASSRPTCFDAADSNDDGRLDIADPINTLEFLFVESGPDALPMPYPDAGEDPTPDGITCAAVPPL